MGMSYKIIYTEESEDTKTNHGTVGVWEFFPWITILYFIQ